MAVVEEVASAARKTREILADDPGQIVQQNWQCYTRARDNGHGDWVREAKAFDRYYYGEQWDEDVLRTLADQKRPAMTINLCLSTINAMVGEYIGTRQDIDIQPVDNDANEVMSEALNKIIRHIVEDSKSKFQEKQMFIDGCVQDRGYMDIRMDYTENVFGEIRERVLDPVNVMLDPGANEYDPRTWNEVIVSRWMTPDQIEEEFGQEHGDAVRFLDPSSTYGYDSAELDPETFSGQKSFFSNVPGTYTYQDDARQVKRVRVIERQYWRISERKFFVDIDTGDKSPVPDDWSKERVQRVVDFVSAQGQRLQVIKKPERRVRWTVSCDKHLLHDDWSPYDWFTVVPFFPYFRRGKPFGVIRNLISPQDVINKTTSQELHVVNTTANSGWKIEAGSLVNMTAQDVERIGAKTGLVLEYNRGSTPPEKIQPNQIPTGLERISTKTVMYFREISGVSSAMLGMPGQEISGTALENKQARGLAQMNVVFDNLALTRQIRGEIILGLIQRFYTDTRLLRIMQKGEEGQMEQAQVVINEPDPVTGEILNDVTLGEYKIIVTSRPSKETEAESDVSQLVEMRNAGIMIPDWAVVEASNISNRREIADWIRKTQGAAQPTEEEVKLAQITQELALQMQVAQVDEMRAKAQERLANAAKLMAEAQTMPAEIQAQMTQAGAQMRMDLEKTSAELQKTREELMTRLAIAREKGQTERYTAGLQAITKKLDSQSKERIASMRGSARVAASKK